MKNHSELTKREREVLRIMMKSPDTSDKGLAMLLGISHKTVDSHLKRIRMKLQVKTRTAALMRWIEMTALFLVCLNCYAQPRLHIFRDNIAVYIGVEDPETQQSVNVQMSTDLVNWQYTDLVHYYIGEGHQTNWATIYEPGSRFFRLVPMTTNASFMVVTSLAKPATNFESWVFINGRESATMVYSNDCMTATISYSLPPGTWQIQHNGDLRGKRQTLPSCIEGDDWRKLINISGPATNNVKIALPMSTPGFLRIRKV